MARDARAAGAGVRAQEGDPAAPLREADIRLKYHQEFYVFVLQVSFPRSRTRGRERLLALSECRMALVHRRAERLAGANDVFPSTKRVKVPHRQLFCFFWREKKQKPSKSRRGAISLKLL